MNALEKLKSRPHWWVAYHGFGTETDAPATGGRVLPISAKTPAIINRSSAELVLTPIFETRPDAEAFVAEFRAQHPNIIDLWEKFGPVMMTPKQVEECLLGEHCVPIMIYHAVIEEFIRRYVNGYIAGNGPGPAAHYGLHMMQTTDPDPAVL